MLKLGVDISTLIEELNIDAKYFDNGKEVNPVELLRLNGVTLIRLRVWNNPYSVEGKPYLGGTNDISRTIDIINKTKHLGYQYIIDFHYSDFWVDPAKQILPKAWKELGYSALKRESYEFTLSSLKIIKSTGVPIPYIQVGNEITNGFMWPFGALIDLGPGKVRANYPKFCSLLATNIRAVREVFPDTKVIIHLESSNNYMIYDEVFTKLTEYKLDFDIIGMSYYPYWHGTFKELFYNINFCHEKFHKNVMIMELGYGFTLEDYILTNNGVNQMKVNSDNLGDINIPYPITPDGQAEFIEAFLNECKKYPFIEGVVYWEPLWIPGDNICWASEEGQNFIHETGKSTRNEWANQCLFDYSGNMLPGFNKFKL